MVDLAAAPGPFKRGNETGLTYDLKMAAWEWLYREAGCRVIGLEVKLEGPGGRIVDLAAVGAQNTFYIVEVKSSRSDFSRDDHTAGDFTELKGRGRTVTGRTGLAKETLRQAMDYAKETNPEAWREVPAFKQALADYRRVSGKEVAYRNRVASFSTKFHDPKFLGIADFHYLIAPRVWSPAPACRPSGACWMNLRRSLFPHPAKRSGRTRASSPTSCGPSPAATPHL